MVSIRKALSVPLKQYGKFICLPGERILLATRTHIYTVFLYLSMIGLLFSFVAVGVGYVAIGEYISLSSAFLLIAVSGSILVLASLITFASWYYHYYIVTNRKILEIKSIPFFSYSANDVLLDQVRCTELDIKREGLIHMLFNIGNIIITFDRPTHQEAFTLSNIHDPENIGLFLGDMLETRKIDATTIWTKTPHDTKYRLTDEISPSSFLLQN